MCLDMNAFYHGLVPEEERCRVESLEPFDEYEVSCVGIIFFLWGCGSLSGLIKGTTFLQKVRAATNNYFQDQGVDQNQKNVVADRCISIR